jgi:hypothetical protein
METSTLTKSQVKTWTKEYTEGGQKYIMDVTARFDDDCNNGHNSFAITADVYKNSRTERNWESGGCLHEEVAKHFPELAKYIKWHLCSTDEPMHYIANTVYHAECGKLDYARSSAVWPEATDEELNTDGLADRLNARKPQLMADFKAAMEELGFNW